MKKSVFSPSFFCGETLCCCCCASGGVIRLSPAEIYLSFSSKKNKPLNEKGTGNLNIINGEHADTYTQILLDISVKIEGKNG